MAFGFLRRWHLPTAPPEAVAKLVEDHLRHLSTLAGQNQLVQEEHKPFTQCNTRIIYSVVWYVICTVYVNCMYKLQIYRLCENIYVCLHAYV